MTQVSTDDAPVGEFAHKAFISYGRADARLAQALQWGLEQLAKPRRTPKIFDVFLDTSDLSGGGTLPDRLTEALASSEHLLVLLSPAAAGSKWVDREVTGWLMTGRPEDIVLVLAGGDLTWEGDRPGRWSEGSLACLPPSLHRAFEAEPLWVDLRAYSDLADADAADRLTLDNAEFKYHVARLQAPLRGPDVKPSDIVGEDLEIHRASERLRRRVITGLAVLTLLAVIGGLAALWFADRSANQERVARSKQLAGQSVDTSGSQLDLGLLLAVEAVGVDDNVATFGRLANAAIRAEDIDVVLHAHENPVRAVAVSTDGQLFATVDTAGSVMLWRSATNELVAGPLPVEFGDSDVLQDLEFDPAGGILVASGHDGDIHRWDVSEPSDPVILPPYVPFGGAAVTAIEVAPDGSWFAASSGVADDGTCTVTNDDGSPVDTPVVTIDAATGETTMIGQRKGCVLAIDVGPDGDRVAVGDQVGVVAVYDLTGATPGIGFVAHPDSTVADIAFHPDGERLVTVGWDGLAHVWDLADPTRPVTTFGGHADVVRSVDISVDGSTVVTAGRGHEIELWNIDSGAVTHELSAGHSAEVRDAEFVGGGSRIVSVGSDRKVVLWHAAGGRRISTLIDADSARAVSFDAETQAFHAAGGRILPSDSYETNAARPGFVRASPTDGDSEARRVVTSSPVYAVAGRGGLSVVGLLDGAVEIYDLRRSPGDPVRRWTQSDLGCPTTGANGVRAVATHELSASIAIGYFDGTIVVVENPGDDEEIKCARASGPVWDLAFVPGTNTVVSSNGDDRLHIWSLDDDTIDTVGVATEIVRSIAFDAGGDHLAVGGSDGEIVIVDATDYSRVGQPLDFHATSVLDVAFHPKRSMLASSGADGSVVLWNLDTGLALTGPSFDVDASARALAWTDDGDTLVTASAAATEVWDLRTSSMRQAVCEAVGRDLTGFERRAFVGGGGDDSCER